MEAGASGYLLKDIKREELAEAIRRVNSGEVAICESIKDKAQFLYENQQYTQTEDGGPDVALLRIPMAVGAARRVGVAGEIGTAVNRILPLLIFVGISFSPGLHPDGN